MNGQLKMITRGLQAFKRPSAVVMMSDGSFVVKGLAFLRFLHSPPELLVQMIIHCIRSITMEMLL